MKLKIEGMSPERVKIDCPECGGIFRVIGASEGGFACPFCSIEYEFDRRSRPVLRSDPGCRIRVQADPVPAPAGLFGELADAIVESCRTIRDSCGPWGCATRGANRHHGNSRRDST